MTDRDTTTADLAGKLPDYLPRDASTGNYKLLYAIAQYIQDLEHNLDSIDNAVNVQEAETIDQLRELAKMVELVPETNESTDHFRARLLVEYGLTSGEGTIDDVINGTAELLDIAPEKVEYNEPILGGTENGTASVGVPDSAVKDSALTKSEVGNQIDRLAPAGCRVTAIIAGTFTYITPSDYNANNHDADLGYDGLDSNGNQKDNGGVYAGVI